MKSYAQLLLETTDRNQSIICFGMDPVIEKIPLSGEARSKITRFYTDLLEAISEKIGAVKPNYAFFAQYGFPGLKAMEKLIAIAKTKKLPVILDAKRGDIGKTSEAYAKEAFDFWKADAVTVSPYMGTDSVMPFVWPGKGVYVLVRTSNPGASEFQQQKMQNGKELFMQAAAKTLEWGTGAVVGATNIPELEKIAKFLSGKVPILVPGIGAQGGSVSEAAFALKKYGNLSIHRINSSSGISYAGKDYVSMAEKEVDKLNKAIGL